MLYYTGDSRHTQNIQINKVIGENEKRVFHITEKTRWTFWPTQEIGNCTVNPNLNVCHYVEYTLCSHHPKIA